MGKLSGPGQSTWVNRGGEGRKERGIFPLSSRTKDTCQGVHPASGYSGVVKHVVIEV